MDPQTRFFTLLDRNPTYPLAAYAGVQKGLDYTVRMIQRNGHVSGQELSLGIAGYLKSEYGPFAGMVLEGWNIHTTLDFGHIVYNLIEMGMMRKQDSDSLEDFLDVYSFQDVFYGDFDWLKDIRQDWNLSPARKK